MAKKRTTSKDSTVETHGYAVKMVGTRKYLHMDPMRGDTWGSKAGAFLFRTEYMAAQFAPVYTKNQAFEIVPVPLEG